MGRCQASLLVSPSHHLPSVSVQMPLFMDTIRQVWGPSSCPRPALVTSVEAFLHQGRILGSSGLGLQPTASVARQCFSPSQAGVVCPSLSTLQRRDRGSENHRAGGGRSGGKPRAGEPVRAPCRKGCVGSCVREPGRRKGTGLRPGPGHSLLGSGENAASRRGLTAQLPQAGDHPAGECLRGRAEGERD